MKGLGWNIDHPIGTEINGMYAVGTITEMRHALAACRQC